jgi:hypothetical protein
MTLNLLERKNVCYDNNRKSVKTIFPNNNKKEEYNNYHKLDDNNNNYYFINNNEYPIYNGEKSSKIAQEVEKTEVYHGIKDTNKVILNFVNNTENKLDACLDAN